MNSVGCTHIKRNRDRGRDWDDNHKGEMNRSGQQEDGGVGGERQQVD